MWHSWGNDWGLANPYSPSPESKNQSLTLKPSKSREGWVKGEEKEQQELMSSQCQVWKCPFHSGVGTWCNSSLWARGRKGLELPSRGEGGVKRREHWVRRGAGSRQWPHQCPSVKCKSDAQLEQSGIFCNGQSSGKGSCCKSFPRCQSLTCFWWQMSPSPWHSVLRTVQAEWLHGGGKDCDSGLVPVTEPRHTNVR